MPPLLNIFCFCRVLFCAHLCMKCSLGISNFLWEIPSLCYSIVFLGFIALFTQKGFLISPCSSLELCIQMVYLSFFPLPFTSVLFSAICKGSSDNNFAFLFLGDGFDDPPASVQFVNLCQNINTKLINLYAAENNNLVIKNNEYGCWMPKFNSQPYRFWDYVQGTISFLPLSFLICKISMVLLVELISKEFCENQITWYMLNS